jgi:hypothetical protein
MTPSRPLTPRARETLRSLSRQAPENILPWLGRSDMAPASPAASACIIVTIDTWSQPGVTSGCMRQLCFDPKTDRFWIIETGGVSPVARWYGPALSQRALVRAAPLIEGSGKSGG